MPYKEVVDFNHVLVTNVGLRNCDLPFFIGAHLILGQKVFVRINIIFTMKVYQRVHWLNK